MPHERKTPDSVIVEDGVDAEIIIDLEESNQPVSLGDDNEQPVPPLPIPIPVSLDNDSDNEAPVAEPPSEVPMPSLRRVDSMPLESPKQQERTERAPSSSPPAIPLPPPHLQVRDSDRTERTEKTTLSELTTRPTPQHLLYLTPRVPTPFPIGPDGFEHEQIGWIHTALINEPSQPEVLPPRRDRRPSSRYNCASIKSETSISSCKSDSVSETTRHQHTTLDQITPRQRTTTSVSLQVSVTSHTYQAGLLDSDTSPRSQHKRSPRESRASCHKYIQDSFKGSELAPDTILRITAIVFKELVRLNLLRPPYQLPPESQRALPTPNYPVSRTFFPSGRTSKRVSRETAKRKKIVRIQDRSQVEVDLNTIVPRLPLDKIDSINQDQRPSFTVSYNCKPDRKINPQRKTEPSETIPPRPEAEQYIPSHLRTTKTK